MAPTELRRRAVVRVTHAAFVDMLLVTAEAALVSPVLTARSFEHLDTYFDERPFDRGRGRRALPPSLIFSETGLEVGGVLFGRAMHVGTTSEIVVERMIPTTAAIRCDDYIERSPLSARTIDDLAHAAGSPFGRVLGDFHSHPLLAASIVEIEAKCLYAPSRFDFDVEGSVPGDIGLVMTITFSERGRKRANGLTALSPSTAHVRISDFEVWLSAYASGDTAKAPQPMLDLKPTKKMLTLQPAW